MAEDQVKIKKESESFNDSVESFEGDHYPFGTSLSLEDDLIEELGAGALAAGDVVEVRGFAFVDSKSEHSNTEGSHKSMRLQLTSLKLRREESDTAEQLYGPR